MNIEIFVNNYLQNYRHEILLNPYNGLVEFAKVFQEKLMEEAVEGTYNNSDWGTPCIDLPSPLELERFDKVRIIIVKE